MSALLREKGEQERDLARFWWQLAPSTLLSLEDGALCRLHYTGQPGGPAGPDVRDVVLSMLPTSPGDEENSLTGDVEFHLHASDWFTHGHHKDPRYNQVILHVVLYLDNTRPTLRQDGVLVPTCSLLDGLQLPTSVSTWPCQHRPLPASEVTATLLQAGLLRFTEKSQELSRALAETAPGPACDVYDACFLPALAEGLGYGRDRAFFYAAGLRLVERPGTIPEPLGRAPIPAPLDVRRLRTLRLFWTRWREAGAWRTLQAILLKDRDVKATIAALRAALHPLSRARADILIVNIILPFALAVAEREKLTLLAVRAQSIYLAYPGLVSNRVTRTMSTQLQLTEEPGQACLQQGLHFVYASTCRTKTCQKCLFGGQRR